MSTYLRKIIFLGLSQMPHERVLLGLHTYVHFACIHMHVTFVFVSFLHSLRPQQSNSVALDRTQVWQYVSTSKPVLISACISKIRRFSQVTYLKFFSLPFQSSFKLFKDTAEFTQACGLPLCWSVIFR